MTTHSTNVCSDGVSAADAALGLEVEAVAEALYLHYPARPSFAVDTVVITLLSARGVAHLIT